MSNTRKFKKKKFKKCEKIKRREFQIIITQKYFITFFQKINNAKMIIDEFEYVSMNNSEKYFRTFLFEVCKRKCLNRKIWVKNYIFE